MSWSIELYVVSHKRGVEYGKNLEFDEIKEFLEIKQYDKSYDEYIKPSILYFTENLNELAKELNVNKIAPEGLYISGIYGGERKKGKEQYAGITLHEYRYNGAKFEFRLWNTKDVLVAPIELLRKYGIRVYKMVYRGEINPFKLRKLIDVMLSELGESNLKRFLQEVVKINIDRIAHSETTNMIEKLIEQVEQPEKIATLDTDKYYVAYRRMRAFTAFAFKPQEPNIIIDHSVAYTECGEENIAYYYAATLNYLTYKVVELSRSFNRDQYARPLLAVYIAGLAWNDVDEPVRDKVVELSKVLHKKAPDKKYANQKVALRDITVLPEFKELVELLDSKVDKEVLENALDVVSGKGLEEEEDE
jgi:hypothetical protein